MPISVSIARSNGHEHLAPLFQRIASFIPAGVAILSNSEVTITLSSLQWLSFDPPMVSLALARDSKKGKAILDGGRLSTGGADFIGLNRATAFCHLRKPFMTSLVDGRPARCQSLNGLTRDTSPSGPTTRFFFPTLLLSGPVTALFDITKPWEQ